MTDVSKLKKEIAHMQSLILSAEHARNQSLTQYTVAKDEKKEIASRLDQTLSENQKLHEKIEQ